MTRDDTFLGDKYHNILHETKRVFETKHTFEQYSGYRLFTQLLYLNNKAA